MKWGSYVTLIFCVHSVVSETLIPQFKKCSSKDTACLKDAIEDALPKLAIGIKSVGVPPLDPIRSPKLTIPSTDSVQLTQKLKDIDFSGLSTTKLTNYPKLDLDGGKMSFDVLCPLAEFKGLYDLDGKINGSDVYGNGKFTEKYINIKGNVTIDMENYEKDGKTHLRFTKFIFNAFPEKVIVQLDNLFNGNVTLGESINKEINDNWKEVYEGSIGDYLKVISEYLRKLSNKLLENIPLKDMFLE